MSEDRNATAAPTTQPEPNPSGFFSARSRRQFGVFLGGATFVGLATLITRRSLIARHRASIPKFYQPSNLPGPEVNGGMDAVDALSLATINVASLALMLTGGALWAFDISTPQELRQVLRNQLNLGPNNGGSSDTDREAEEWLASILTRNEEGEKDTPAALPKGKGLEDLLVSVLAREVKQQQKAKSDESGKDQ